MNSSAQSSSPSPSEAPAKLGINEEKATLAGGCFWCIQSLFDKVKGVIRTDVGYLGGSRENPTYDQVSSGATGHTEAVEVTFDPTIISYSEVLDIFWKDIDPTVENAQFADKGTQYRTVIFYNSDRQKQLAMESKQKLEDSKVFSSPIKTAIEPSAKFYRAEEYHQKYYQKQPDHYNRYEIGSGRKGFVSRIWGSKTPEILK